MSSNRHQLKQTLNVSLSQRLALTPSLLQKIELLTLSRLELTDLLNQELVENPLLEEVLDEETPKEISTELKIDPPENYASDGQAEDTPKTEEDDFDYGSFFSNYLEPGYKSREYEDIEKPSFETFLVKSTSLYDHLNWQLSLSHCDEEIRKIAVHIIGNVNEDGYLRITNEELSQEAQCSLEKAEEAIRFVQDLDPLGVASRDLKECLLIQLKARFGENTLAQQIVQEHLGLVQAHKYKEIAELLGCTLAEIGTAMEMIRKLDPQPGQKYNPVNTQYIQPDVHIYKVDNEYVILLNEDGMPRLRLNAAYREMLRGNGVSSETKNFIKDRVRSAVELLKSIDQRKRTIYRVCTAIIKRQREFFDNGIEFLKPMLIKDVADELGVHSSTISRVVTNKYAHTPQGVMELRRFFTVGVQKTDGEELSIVNVKSKLKNIIGNEDLQRPYSDHQIAEILKRQGIQITRRTVAKYRDQLHIRGSRERKMIHLI